jgi:rubrerythrin
MKLKLLNSTQAEQLARLLSFYKHFYICNDCGSVYGADFFETKERACPTCEAKHERDKK